jgi:hypothetical protein
MGGEVFEFFILAFVLMGVCTFIGDRVWPLR